MYFSDLSHSRSSLHIFSTDIYWPLKLVSSPDPMHPLIRKTKSISGADACSCDTNLATWNFLRQTRSTINTIGNLYDPTLHLHQLFSWRQKLTFVMTSKLTLFGDSTMNIKSTRRAFGFFLPAECAVMYTCYQKRRRSFRGVVNFCLSLLSANWVLSAYFHAGLEISVCAY